jgi:diaminohydroxyphosphoribosylaminopyrimidine deaminase/5-amino-6-(5-phosphoribosylamino)uracil reductase
VTLPSRKAEARRVDRILAENEDVLWMRRALAEAAKGRGTAEPNPTVGALVVRDDCLVAAGHTQPFGGAHAEVDVLNKAGEGARGATLYVTLEPCCHFGKTPPCSDAIIAAGISRVVVPIIDPFPSVNGRGLKTLEAHGLMVNVGCEAAAARSLMAPYLKRVTIGMPLVVAKWAMTLDGKTAVSAGDSRWVSSAQSRALVHEMRGRMDGIVVGIATVDADDPLLTARPPGPRLPARIVLDSSARLPISSQLVRTTRDGPVIVAVTERATAAKRDQLVQLGCDVVPFPGNGRVPIGLLLTELGRRGMSNVMVEGGGQVLGSFADDGHIDQLEVFIAPVLEGGDHARTALRGKGLDSMRDALRLRDVKISEVGGDVHLSGWVPQVWRARAGFGPHE